MKEIIHNSFLTENNINIENEQMPNGEKRFRVRWSDLSGVNITNSSDESNWQNAHYHKTCKELYVVQKGKILLATLKNKEVEYKELKKGDVIVIEPLISHNIYMFKNSMTYVIKFGEISEDDWYYDEELDKISKKYAIK